MAVGKRFLIGACALVALLAVAVVVVVTRPGAGAARRASASADLPVPAGAAGPGAGPAAVPAGTPSATVPSSTAPPLTAPALTAPPVTGPARPGAPVDPGAGWKLMWSPSAARDGLAAFEGVEDDRAHSDPGARHIYVADGHFRFDMNMKVRDSSPDRQRNEVKGMHAGNTDLALGPGETWRLQWSLFIPDSLRATTTFTHIMQLKMPGNGTSPIVTMSLRRVGDVPEIELQVNQSGTIVGRADLAPLQNTWVDTAVEFQIGDAGSIHWTLASGGKTVLDATKSDVDLFLQDRVRPKWGIYRSLGDKSGSLRDCFLLLDNMRAYRKQ
jgi:hypothetical protein